VTARVFLHVGVPKTGTTFVQDVLWRARSQLAKAGVCYPLLRRAEHFAATMDLRGAFWGGRRDPAWEGTWDRLAGTVLASGAHTGLLSSELLAAADVDAAERAGQSFPGYEVHVVLTARDLARQLVSGWQEQVKHRLALSLEDFVARCLDGTGREAERFWRLHDLPDVARRWGTAIPAAHLHVVTVPPPGGPRDLLWQRFAQVCGLDVSLGRVDTARPNTSLTAPEAELLRRYNARGTDQVTPRHYDQVVRVLLAEKLLAAGSTGAGDTGGLALPARFADAVSERARSTVAELAGNGHDVAGDLADLVPDRDALREVVPAPVDDAQVAAVSVRAVADLVAELGPLERRLRARGQAPATDATATPGQETRRRRRPVQRGDDLDRAVFVHVGAPKTGTTFLQDVLWYHRDSLAAAGVLFSRRRYDDHYRASLDLREQPRPGAAGIWDQVAGDSAGWPGTSVISHEFFAAAKPPHVARAMASLGSERVHVVYTARDLWRLLGAEWQEVTKHGRHLSFEEFLADVLDRGEDGMVGGWFWSVHDAVDVLRRWSAELPPERVHVVTVPPSGTDPTLLWRRFCAVLGIDPGLVDTTVARPNTSLGAAEVTFLRRVNERLGERRQDMFRRGEYARFVKTMLAQEVLSARPGSARYAPPTKRFEQVRTRAEQLTTGLRAAGYQVVGDLCELVPEEPRADSAHPDDTPAPELADVGVDAVAGMVLQVAQLRESYGIGITPTTAQGPGRPGPRTLARRLARRVVTGRGGHR